MNFNIQVVIPEAAEIEREEQWLRDLTAASQSYASAVKKRSNLLNWRRLRRTGPR